MIHTTSPLPIEIESSANMQRSTIPSFLQYMGFNFFHNKYMLRSMVTHVHLSGPDQTNFFFDRTSKGEKISPFEGCKEKGPLFWTFFTILYVHGGVELATPCVGDMCKHLWWKTWMNVFISTPPQGFLTFQNNILDIKWKVHEKSHPNCPLASFLPIFAAHDFFLLNRNCWLVMKYASFVDTILVVLVSSRIAS